MTIEKIIQNEGAYNGYNQEIVAFREKISKEIEENSAYKVSLSRDVIQAYDTSEVDYNQIIEKKGFEKRQAEDLAEFQKEQEKARKLFEQNQTQNAILFETRLSEQRAKETNDNTIDRKEAEQKEAVLSYQITPQKRLIIQPVLPLESSTVA